MKRLLALMILACGASYGTSLTYAFTTPTGTVGSNDSIQVEVSIQLNGNAVAQTVSLFSLDLQTFATNYNFTPSGSSISVADGGTAFMMLGTLTPKAGPVPTGTYTLGTVMFSVNGAQMTSTPNANFQRTVSATSTVPEPNSFALLATGLLAVAFVGSKTSRRKNI